MKIKPMNKKSAFCLYILMFLLLTGLFADYYRLFLVSTILLISGLILGLIMIIFNKSLGILSRFIFLFFVIPLSISSYQHILDIPVYLTKDYSKIEGIALIEQGTGRGAGLGISIKDVDLGYDVPSSIKVTDSGKYFKISYLPHTKIIVHWEIKE